MTKKEYVTLPERIRREGTMPLGIELYDYNIGYLRILGTDVMFNVENCVTIITEVPIFVNALRDRFDITSVSYKLEDKIFGGIYYKLNRDKYKKVVKSITIHRKFIRKIVWK